MQLLGTSIIGFDRTAPGPASGHAIAPSGTAIEPAFHWATPQDIDRAARAADAAFAAYRLITPARRAQFLQAIATLLEQNVAPLTERAAQETALPLPRLQGELVRTCGQLRLYAGLLNTPKWTDPRIDLADPNRKPAPKPDIRSLNMPLGPVVVFGASNFPFAYSVAGGDTASALAVGCPVIVKAHNGHLGTSELVGTIVQQAARDTAMPDGVFSLLFGEGNALGQALVKHPLIRAVGFTGSRAGGRALMDIAAARPVPIPVYAEMSSVNPIFILPAALHDRCDDIATGLAASVLLGVGQFCTNPGLVYTLTSPDSDRFAAALKQRIAAAPPATMLGPQICRNYHNGAQRLASAPGVETLVDSGVTHTNPTTSQASPSLFRTTAANVLTSPHLMDEVFGPSTLLIHAASIAELLEAARAVEGQLTATIHASDAELAQHAELLHILETRAGRIIFNGFPTGVEVCDAICHGGPYPATSDGRTTSVGSRAIERFTRMISYQNAPQSLLPDPLRDTPLQARG